jgi:O-antigen/teichoic acid export membrane protein
MVKKFLNSLAIIFALNLLIKPVWIFGIDLTVQNRLGPEAYGTYYALLSLSFLFNILLDLGLTHFNNREIAQNPEAISQRYGRVASIKGVLGLAYLGLLIPTALLLGYDAQAIQLLLLLAINQFLLSYMLFLRSNISGLQFFKTDALLSVADKSLMILTCGWLLFWPPGHFEFTIIDFAWTQSLGLFLAVLLGMLAISKRGVPLKVTFQWTLFQNALKESWQYALLIALMAFHNRLDGLMLERLSGAASAGVYAAAYRLVEALNQFSYLTAVLLLPMFSRMLAQRENPAPLAQTAWSVLMVAGVGVAALGFFFGPELMQVMYAQKGVETGQVFIPLAFGFSGYAMSFVFGSLLTAKGDLRALNNIAGLALLANGLLNLLLIPKYGAWGAAMTTFLTQGLAAILQFWICKKRFLFSWSFILYVRLALFMGLAFVSTGAIFYWLHFTWLGFLIAGISIPIWALMLGWVDVKGIQKLIKEAA